MKRRLNLVASLSIVRTPALRRADRRHRPAIAQRHLRFFEARNRAGSRSSTRRTTWRRRHASARASASSITEKSSRSARRRTAHPPALRGGNHFRRHAATTDFAARSPPRPVTRENDTMFRHAGRFQNFRILRARERHGVPARAFTTNDHLEALFLHLTGRKLANNMHAIRVLSTRLCRYFRNRTRRAYLHRADRDDLYFRLVSGSHQELRSNGIRLGSSTRTATRDAKIMDVLKAEKSFQVTTFTNPDKTRDRRRGRPAAADRKWGLSFRGRNSERAGCWRTVGLHLKFSPTRSTTSKRNRQRPAAESDFLHVPELLGQSLQAKAAT